MKYWNTICLLVAVLFAGTGCVPDAAQQVQDSPDTTKVDAPVAMVPVGYRKKVFAIGHPFVDRISDEWELYEEFTYDTAGHEIEFRAHFDGRGTHVVTAYDPQGYVLRTTHTNDLNAERIEFRSTWNADHTVQTTEEYSQTEGRVVSRSRHTFDAQAKLLSTEEEDLHLPDFHPKTQTRYRYDAAQRLIEQREIVQGKEIIGVRYSYDAAGNATQVERFDAEGHPSQIEDFNYDAQGRKRSRHLQDPSAFYKTKQLKTRYEYDTQGHLSKELHYGGQCDIAGEMAGKCIISETVVYTYDAQGHLLTEDRDGTVNQQEKQRKRFDYEGDVPASK
jgi:YD repeat-containing protein